MTSPCLSDFPSRFPGGLLVVPARVTGHLVRPISSFRYGVNQGFRHYEIYLPSVYNFEQTDSQAES
jgi:hypothetical protein